MAFFRLAVVPLLLFVAPVAAQDNVQELAQAVRELNATESQKSGSSGAFWGIVASVVGGGLSAVLGMVAVAVVKRWQRPRLAALIDAKRGSIHEAIAGHDIEGESLRELYVRLIVKNTGKDAARGCRAFLTGVFEFKGDSFVEKDFHDVIRLKFAYNKEVMDLVKDVHYFIDLVGIAKINPLPMLCLGDYANKYLGLLMPPGQYKLRVVITSENAEPITQDVIFLWPGRYEDASATVA